MYGLKECVNSESSLQLLTFRFCTWQWLANRGAVSYAVLHRWPKNGTPPERIPEGDQDPVLMLQLPALDGVTTLQQALAAVDRVMVHVENLVRGLMAVRLPLTDATQGVSTIGLRLMHVLSVAPGVPHGRPGTPHRTLQCLDERGGKENSLCPTL